jgi:hypothetical protein
MNTSTNPLEAARLDWAENPSAANEKKFYDLKRAADLAEARASLAARKAAEEAERASVKATAAKRKRLAEVTAIANGFSEAMKPHREWFAKTQLEAQRRVMSALDLVTQQQSACREAQQLANDLGVTIEIAGETHEGNVRGEVARAQGDALRAAGLGRASVADYFRPVHE